MHLVIVMHLCRRSEDWFGDSKASEWSYLAARLRAASSVGETQSFGGCEYQVLCFLSVTSGTHRGVRYVRAALPPSRFLSLIYLTLHCAEIAADIVPRGPTGGVAHGTSGLLMKALTLVGSGAKGFQYFDFGPEWSYPGNCFSAIALQEENHTLFAQIAESSRIISGAEELLYPGQMRPGKVAALYPRSSFMWDNATAPHSPHGTEDPGLSAMGYLAPV